MRNHRTTSELQSIVGSDRANHSQRTIAAAERELALRADGEEALFQRKLTRSGLICAGIGLLCVLWPAALLLLSTQAGMPTQGPGPDAPFVFRHFNTIFMVTGWLQILCGTLLVSGGLAVRARRRIGPSLLASVIGVAMLWVVGFSLLFPLGVVLGSAPGLFVVLIVGFSTAWSAFLLFLLWLPLRFFISPRVRLACASSRKKGSGRG